MTELNDKVVTITQDTNPSKIKLDSIDSSAYTGYDQTSSSPGIMGTLQL